MAGQGEYSGTRPDGPQLTARVYNMITITLFIKKNDDTPTVNLNEKLGHLVNFKNATLFEYATFNGYDAYTGNEIWSSLLTLEFPLNELDLIELRVGQISTYAAMFNCFVKQD